MDFVFIILFLFCSEAMPISAQKLFLVGLGNIWGIRDRILAGHMQGKHLAYCTVSPALKLTDFKGSVLLFTEKQ